MTVDIDAIVDRRRMRRKLTFWRVIAFALVAVFLIGAIGYFSGFPTTSKRSAHIARIPIEGVIVENRDLVKMIDRAAESSAVKGVILSINSPGGSTTGGEAIYEAVRQLADKKPVVSEIRTVGASAGYMIAIAADHTVARYNSITGSIGVYFQYGNVAELLDTLGISMDAVKSSSLKAEPDFYSPATPEAQAMLSDLVTDSYEWFVALVADRRALDPSIARGLADGRIFTGHSAKEAALIDAIGGEAVAVSWLEDEKNVPEDLPIVTWSIEDELSDLPFAASLARNLGQGLGMALTDSLDEAKGLIPRGLTLDGLVSVWQAPIAAEDTTAVRGGAK